MTAPHPALLPLITDDERAQTTRITGPLVDSAIEHGVAPLVDDAVRRLDLDVEHDALVLLAMHSLDSAAATAAARTALGSLLDIADSLGIELAVFKGIAIGSRWYSRPELRPAVDIDVFTAPDQSARLGEFAAAVSSKPKSRAVVDAMVAEGRVFEYPLFIDGVTVDLHLDPMNLVVPIRQRAVVWERTECIDIGEGRRVRGLDLELSIIQALLHLLRDGFADLLHVYDLSLMLDDDPDWGFIQQFADTEGLTDAIRFSVGVVCDILDRPPPIPTDLSPYSQAVTAIVWPRRSRLGGFDGAFDGPHRQSLASLLISGRRLAVASALARRVFPPRVVIDDRSPGCDCPYPIALLRWRLAQRTEIKRRRTPARRAAEHAAN